MLIVIIQVNAKTYAQTVTLSQSKASLEKVLDDIRKQSGYDFFYELDPIKNAKPVTVKLTNEGLESALRKIFDNQPNLTYSLTEKDKAVIIKGKSTSVSQLKINPSQEIEIRGKITDTDNIPLPGALIKVSGTDNAVSANESGEFTIAANVGDVLEISMIGFVMQTFIVEKESTIAIKLETTNEELSEVVVVGYGTQRKVNLTGSIATISTKDIENRSNTNILTSVQGLAPGVTVISRPGETPSINLRGRGNLGTSAPLFVIDGVISDQTIFSNLDPNSIESISFLKDAASASIYGSRAAYGVVLVTTKGGKAGKMAVTYNGFVGTKTPTYLPDMLNSTEYAELFNEGRINRGLAPLYTAEQIEKFRNGSDPDNYPNTRWFDLVLDQKVVTTQHSLNFSGGTEKTRFYTGLNYLYDDQFMPGQDNKRYNLHSRLSSDVTGWLTINSNISYIRTQADRVNGATSNYHMQFVPPILVARQSNGEWGTIAGGTAATQNYINYNPLRALSRNDWSHSNVANTIFDLSFDLKPIEGLVITGQGSYTGIEGKSKSYTGLQENAKNFVTGNDIPGTGNTVNKMDQSWSNNSRLLFTGTAKYDWSKDNHNVSLLAGTSYEQTNYEALSASRRNFPADVLTDLSAGSNAPEDMTNSGGVSEFSLNSYFGRINYRFLERYLLEANIRTDGSSRFHRDHRWGVFPSVSAGWIISEESFLKEAKWIDLLKIRGSYGALGNINNVGNYDYFQNYNNSLNYNFNGQSVPGISEAQPANPSLGWEKVVITDVGIDLGLLNNKLNITADYYMKKTDDILLAYNVPVEVGVMSNPSQNIGKLQNEGFEVSLNYNNQVRDFTYSVGGNVAYNKNKITDLGGSDNMIYGGGDVIQYIYRVGESIGAYYGYKTNGLYSQEEIDNGEYYVFGRTPMAGDIKYVPQHENVAWGDEITGDDRMIIGGDVPKYTYGLNFNLSYKNLDFSVFGQGISGAHVAFENDAYMAFFEGGNSRKFHLQRWTSENPDPYAVYPRIYGGSSLDNYNRENFSEYQLFDADYFRIKSISLGYTIPEAWLSRNKISSLRVFMNLENMFTIRSDKKMKDFDPETASSRSLGIGTKTISFGVNLNL